MKTVSMVAILVIWAVLPGRLVSMESAPVQLALATSTNRTHARITFDALIHDFGKIVGGQSARHDFTFTNTGDAVLELTGVHASCGCTTAGAWSKKVDPGQTGTIPIVFNSGHFMGPITKTINVTCNDPNQQQVVLQIRGDIWKPIQVTPQTAVLNIIADSPTNPPTTVKIVSSLPEPVEVSAPVINSSLFTAELQTNVPGKEYQLVIQTSGPLPQGTTQATITMKTSNTNVPTLEITAFAFAQPPWVITPADITLPQGPLPSAFPRAISVRNNSQVPVTLSEVELNASNVPVEVRTNIPGRQYTVVMQFPAGFKVATGGDLRLSMKTSDPKRPEILVPVRPSPTPAAQQSPATPPASPVPLAPASAPLPPALPGPPASQAFQVH